MQSIISFLLLFNCFTFADIDSKIAKKPLQSKYAVGDKAHGGIVFYVDPTGEHGLVCAPHDQKLNGKPYTVWGCLGSTIRGARGTAIGTGEHNTQDIIEKCTKGETAADVCAKLRLNGRNDWYLPSKAELNEMYKAKRKGKLHFKRSGYWSSTGTGNGNAWVQTMGMGFQFISAKYGSHRVRAVRKF